MYVIQHSNIINMGCNKKISFITGYNVNMSRLVKSKVKLSVAKKMYFVCVLFDVLTRRACYVFVLNYLCK